MTTEKGSSASLGRPCILIIVVAGVERFAFKGVASNMVNYLTGVVGMSTAAAAQSVSAWVGITSMLPLVSAVLADSYWDRYSTVTASSLLYVAGLAGLASWALGTTLQRWRPGAALPLPLYLISIGQGAYNPSRQAFGADQLDIGDEDEDGGGGGTAEEKGKVKSAFFQWWYFGICCGSLLGNTTMSYVQDTVGWGIGFAVPCAAMALSVAAFLCCTPLYKKISQPRSADRPCSESILRALKSLLASVSAGKIRLSSRHDGQDDGDGKNNASELELQEKPLKLAKLTDPKEANRPGVAKIILRLLPIWTVLLMFAVIFQQPMTFFTKQGTLMDHRVAGGAFVIPPATLQSTITVSIIILMPLYDRVIMPLIGAVTRNSKGITVLQRIGVGMVFSVVAMVVARAPAPPRGGRSDEHSLAAPAEFFYSQVPDAMRTIGIGLYLSVFGVGSLVGTLLIAAIEVATAGGAGKGHGWFSDDPREERLDNYYWFLVLLSSVSFVIFTQLCRCYN
uniref:Peptide transporter PTR5 n=1 Tax=Aegilops tauschii TaxID=37682 RepID=M8BM88_AEGTA